MAGRSVVRAGEEVVVATIEDPETGVALMTQTDRSVFYNASDQTGEDVIRERIAPLLHMIDDAPPTSEPARAITVATEHHYPLRIRFWPLRQASPRGALVRRIASRPRERRFARRRTSRAGPARPSGDESDPLDLGTGAVA